MSEKTPQPKDSPEEKPPEFSLFRPVLRSEGWKFLKDLFTTKETHMPDEQPHGIDLEVINFVEIKPKGDVLGEIARPKKENKEAPVVFLEPGKEYFAMLYPPLRRPYKESPFIFHLLPRSSLHRAGIAAEEQSFYGTDIRTEMEALGGRFDDYDDGRQAAIRIFIANPNGVEVEQFASFVQVVAERFPGKSADEERTALEQELFLEERESEKREPLHLGSVREFLPVRPRIAKEREKSKLDVTVALTPEEGQTYRLIAGRPYLLETLEAVSLSAHELAVTRAEERKEIAAYGDALVDAGFEGKLTYLIIPKKTVTLAVGEPISYLLRIGVPTTKKPYRKTKIGE